MTEDLELSIQGILDGGKVEYVESAIVFDEHPNDFKTSWNQRKRWSTGMLQCLKKYASALGRGAFRGHSASCADAFLYSLTALMQPLVILSTVLTFVIAVLRFGVSLRVPLMAVLLLLSAIIAAALLSVFLIIIKKHVKDTGFSAILLMWVFWLSWVIINSICIFRPETVWKPIRHTGRRAARRAE